MASNMAALACGVVALVLGTVCGQNVPYCDLTNNDYVGVQEDCCANVFNVAPVVVSGVVRSRCCQTTANPSFPTNCACVDSEIPADCRLPASACPGVTPLGRLANANAVTQPCNYHGVIGLGYRTSSVSAPTLICNGQYTFNTEKNRREIWTDESCYANLRDKTAIKYQLVVYIGSNAYAYTTSGIAFWSAAAVNSPSVALVATPDFVSFMEDRLTALGCGTSTSCLPQTNVGQNTLTSDCFVAGYGSDNNAGTSTRLRSARVLIIGDKANCGIPQSEWSNTECVYLRDSTYYCTKDTASGFFCPLSTGEEVLLGMTERVSTCSTTKRYITVYKNGQSRSPGQVCPVVPVLDDQVTGRLIRADNADDCDFKGVISFGIKDPDFFPLCNAVYVYNSYRGRREILTHRTCWEAMKNRANTDSPKLAIKIQKETILISMFDFQADEERSLSGNTVALHPSDCLMRSLERYSAFYGCNRHAACMLTNLDFDDLDLNNCYVYSYGYNGSGVAWELKKSGVWIRSSKTNCPSINTNNNENNLCVSLKDNDEFCRSQDSAAVVFCPHVTTREQVLIGVSRMINDNESSCNSDINEHLHVYTHGISQLN